jgi:hypothetical protein
VRPGLQRAGHQALDGRPGVVRVRGAQRPRAGLHRLEHRDDFLAPDLPDDDPGQVEPQRGVQQVIQGDLAGGPAAGGALTGPGSGLVRNDPLVPLGHLVQVQFVLGLDRSDPLPGVHLVAQRAHQRGLAGALRPGHHDRLVRPHRSRQELCQDAVDHAQALQVGQIDLGEPVPADHHSRPGGDPGPGGQPGAAVQRQVQDGVGRCERPLSTAGGAAGAGGQERQRLDQLLVAVGDRRAGPDPAVAVDQVHPVAAGDLDVLHIRVVHERLQPAQPEQRVEDGCGQGPLLGGAGRRGALGQQAVGVVSQHRHDQRSADLAAGRLVQPGPVAQLRGQQLGGLLPEGPDLTPVHRPAGVGAGRGGQGCRPHWQVRRGRVGKGARRVGKSRHRRDTRVGKTRHGRLPHVGKTRRALGVVGRDGVQRRGSRGGEQRQGGEPVRRLGWLRVAVWVGSAVTGPPDGPAAGWSVTATPAAVEPAGPGVGRSPRSWR